MQMQQLPRCGSRFVLYSAPFGMPLARSFAGEGKRARWLPLFCNQRDARVRVLCNSPTFYFRVRANCMVFILVSFGVSRIVPFALYNQQNAPDAWTVRDDIFRLWFRRSVVTESAEGLRFL
jgi:hypothetical protein